MSHTILSMATQTLDEAIFSYLMMKRNNVSPGSYRQVTSRMTHFRKWVPKMTQPNPYVSVIANHQLQLMPLYFSQLTPPAYSESTHNQARAIMKGFWDYCRAMSWIDVDPMFFVKNLQVPKKHRRQLSPDELLQILEEADTPRDRIALAMGMNTGLRIGDIMRLKIGDVDLFSDTLFAYNQKSKKSMPLPVTAELREELIRWFEAYADAMGVAEIRLLPNNWTLIPAARWRPTSVRRPELGGRLVYKTDRQFTNAHRVVHRALEKLGLPTNQEGFHTLRRSMGRAQFDMLRAQGESDPLGVVKTQLGHKSRSTTEIYLGLTIEEARRDDLMRGKSFLRQAAKLHSQSRERISQDRADPKVADLRRREDVA